VLMSNQSLGDGVYLEGAFHLGQQEGSEREQHATC
jgi:hypothetical protein